MQTTIINDYLIFLTKYIALIILYYLILLIPNNVLFEVYLECSALLSSFFLNMMGYFTSVNNDIIYNSTFSVQLSFGCEGTEPIMLFTAGLLAYKSPILNKILWIILGNLFLIILNNFRIISLFIIGDNYYNLFDDFHTIYFPILMIVTSILLFFIWIRFAKK